MCCVIYIYREKYNDKYGFGYGMTRKATLVQFTTFCLYVQRCESEPYLFNEPGVENRSMAAVVFILPAEDDTGEEAVVEAF